MNDTTPTKKPKLKEKNTYHGVIVGITNAISSYSNATTNYMERFCHQVMMKVDGVEHECIVITNNENDHIANVGDVKLFYIKNYHKGKNNYNISFVASEVTQSMLQRLNYPIRKPYPSMASTPPAIALQMAVQHHAYDREATTSDVLQSAKEILSWLVEYGLPINWDAPPAPNSPI